MRGYVFPPLALWSGGEEVLVIDTPIAEPSLGQVEFLTPPLQQPDIALRQEVEENLIDFLQTTLARLRNCSVEHGELRDVWDRVLASLTDSDERSYCIAAGRLGLDPYDPDGPDLTTFSQGISASLFGDICEAAGSDELSEVSQWIRTSEQLLHDFPTLPISDYGPAPQTDLSIQAWMEGYRAADGLRINLGLKHDDPNRVIKRLFDDMLDKDLLTLPDGPSSIDGLTRRTNSNMQAGVPKRFPPQRRFHACRAAYLAWLGTEGQETAVTIASTRKQQASRAFAAELLAPAQLLRKRAGRHGLTPDDVDALAREFVCPDW